MIETTPAAILADESLIFVTISSGVCTVPGSNIGEMVKAADDLLYKAKNNGRNRVEI